MGTLHALTFLVLPLQVQSIHFESIWYHLSWLSGPLLCCQTSIFCIFEILTDWVAYICQVGSSVLRQNRICEKLLGDDTGFLVRLPQRPVQIHTGTIHQYWVDQGCNDTWRLTVVCWTLLGCEYDLYASLLTRVRMQIPKVCAWILVSNMTCSIYHRLTALFRLRYS